MVGSKVEEGAWVVNEAWYAVWTRSQHERGIERYLRGKGLTAFLPTVPRPSRRTDRRKMLDCPLFPGYLFFYGVGDPSTQLAVLQTPGVVRILREGPDVLTPVSAEQVEAIRNLICSGRGFAAVPSLRLGERVRIRMARARAWRGDHPGAPTAQKSRGGGGRSMTMERGGGAGRRAIGARLTGVRAGL